MYLIMVIGLMVVLPIVSIVVELVLSGGSADPVFVVGKWFLFWGAGIRLLIAGISQSIRPGFTAENILGSTTSDSGVNQIVQELGFANLGFGLVATIGAWLSGWQVAAAIGPGLFLLLAGIRHLPKKGKNTKEWIATLTDLLVGAILVAFAIVEVVTGKH